MDTQDVKPVSFSAINAWDYIILPRDLNPKTGAVFGGRIMDIADQLGGEVAMLHSDTICVTLSVDHMRFWAPGYPNEILRFRVAINRVWGSSMEVGVKVLAINSLKKSEERHIVSAYFTFVALDQDRKPAIAPPVIPETDDERRRYAEADVRRARRLEEAKQKKGA